MQVSEAQAHPRVENGCAGQQEKYEWGRGKGVGEGLGRRSARDSLCGSIKEHIARTYVGVCLLASTTCEWYIYRCHLFTHLAASCHKVYGGNSDLSQQ
jgi:hypothetical protein